MQIAFLGAELDISTHVIQPSEPVKPITPKKVPSKAASKPFKPNPSSKYHEQLRLQFETSSGSHIQSLEFEFCGWYTGLATALSLKLLFYYLSSVGLVTKKLVKWIHFQSQKQLYNCTCLSVCPSFHHKNLSGLRYMVYQFSDLSEDLWDL